MKKPKPFTIEVTVRCSSDGSEWDVGLEKIPARKHKVVAKVLLEAAALLGVNARDVAGRVVRPIGLHGRAVTLPPLRRRRRSS